MALGTKLVLAIVANVFRRHLKHLLLLQVRLAMGLAHRDRGSMGQANVHRTGMNILSALDDANRSYHLAEVRENDCDDEREDAEDDA